MEKWYMPRVWFSTRRRRGSDEIMIHRPTPTPYAGRPHVSCFCTCGRRGDLLSGLGRGTARWAGPPGEVDRGGQPGSSDLAYDTEADKEEADDEEQHPLPQCVQVVLEHEDWGQRGGHA